VEPVSLVKALEGILEQFGPSLKAGGMKVNVRLDRVTVWSGGSKLAELFAAIVGKALRAAAGSAGTSMEIHSKTTEDEVDIIFEFGGLGLAREEAQELDELCGPPRPAGLNRVEGPSVGLIESLGCRIRFSQDAAGLVNRVVVSLPI
jgi:hypothetical protein